MSFLHDIVRPCAVAIALLALCSSTATAQGDTPEFQRVQRLADLSGLVWLGEKTFLTVHDAKYPDEAKYTRVSLLRAPNGPSGLKWKPLRPHWPGGKSNDLESAARVPGTNRVLLVESGDDGSDKDRIYLAQAGKREINIYDYTEWAGFYDVFNVEGTAVASSGDGFIFVWAERQEGHPTTEVHWTDLTLSPFAIGQTDGDNSVTFTLPAALAALFNRPLVGMEIGPAGEIYTVAAFDPNDDNGPFRAAVLMIGRVIDGAVVLNEAPAIIGFLDGFKVESVTLAETDDGMQIFVGTDDENYGGTLRPIPLP